MPAHLLTAGRGAWQQFIRSSRMLALTMALIGILWATVEWTPIGRPTTLSGRVVAWGYGTARGGPGHVAALSGIFSAREETIPRLTSSTS